MTHHSHANSFKGRITEDLVCTDLQRHGWNILARNQHFLGGELDIIAHDPDGILVFLEVKSCWGPNAGRPQAQVHRKKQICLWRAAVAWLMRESINPDQVMRFDVVSLIRTHEGWQVEHLRNAFEGCTSVY